MKEARAFHRRGMAIPGILALGALSGCSLQKIALHQTAGLMDTGMGAVFEEPDPALASEAMPAQLKIIEGLLKSGPRDRRLLELASQGYAGYALLFKEDSEPLRARALYLRSRDYGLRALGLKPGLEGLVGKDPVEMRGALKAAGPEDLRALFWTAVAWAGWINLSKDNPEALLDVPRAVALMEKVRSLDPTYFHGGPDLFLGVYHGRPRFLGGNLALSKDHFEKAAAASGGRFLLTYVRYAKVYAVLAQDRDLFKRLLQKVLDAPEDALPGARLVNAVSKVMAGSLLEKTDDLFE